MRIWLLPFIAALGFLLIGMTDSNRAVFALLNQLGPLTGDWLWANLTVLGDTLVALALCLLLWRRRPDLVWAVLFAALLATLWARGFKPLLEVARPPAVLESLHVIGPAYKASSFPSGHATTVFTLAGILVLAFGWRSWAIGAVALAALVAISRAAVGVHWPLDILAGAFGGWLAAAAGLWIANRTLAFGTRPWVQWTLGVLLACCAAVLVIGHPRNDYPQADLLLRAIGLACLLGAGARLNRDFRRRPGL
jgi:membrane-associated phospholipid phosphatase